MFQLTKIFLLCLTVYEATAISGGRSAVLGEFPSFVGIVLPTVGQVCGATIFNRNHVLTAANCMVNANNLLLSPNQISVLSGSNTINFGNPRIAVLAIYVHPRYNPFTFENDIAVVRTATDFSFLEVVTPLVAPAVVSQRIAFDTQSCLVAAWNTGNNLQQALPVPVLNRDTCNGLATNFGRITETMLCAGITGTGSGVCSINIGGALYCNNRLEGILSSGFSCGTVANTPGVYTQVRYYVPWIEEQVRRQDIPPANVSPIERLP